MCKDALDRDVIKLARAPWPWVAIGLASSLRRRKPRSLGMRPNAGGELAKSSEVDILMSVRKDDSRRNGTCAKQVANMVSHEARRGRDADCFS